MSTPSEIAWGRFRNRQGLIARSTIRRMVEEIVGKFAPERIVLFGSYATGQARPDSDVDLLVVTSARNEIDRALQIEECLDAPFALDIIVRTPRNLARRLRQGDWFLSEAVAQGKVLYEQPDEGMGTKSRSRLGGRTKDSRRKTAVAR